MTTSVDDKTRFAVYCVEEFKAAENLPGKAVIELFNCHGVLEYVREFYDALHTTGRQYIVNDIRDFVTSRQLTIAG